jgi:hypothetical protein
MKRGLSMVKRRVRLDVRSPLPIHAHRRKPRLARRGVLAAVERKEWLRDGVKAEAVAFLNDNAGGFSPDFDQVCFRHGSTPSGLSGGRLPASEDRLEAGSVEPAICVASAASTDDAEGMAKILDHRSIFRVGGIHETLRDALAVTRRKQLLKPRSLY